MAMADCYYAREQQLEVDDAVVHRLLPPEILVDIGIVADSVADIAARQRRSLAVVEELSARLVSILGGGGVGEKRAATPASGGGVTPYSYRRDLHLAGGGINGRNGVMILYHAPSTKQWPPLRPTTFLPPPPPASGSGTGVFLPRTGLASNPPRINGSKPPRQLRKEAARGH
uniref:Uncharacterized protein n=1 Tax=Leersia perrieri TaxID=77586 RepID=A0A0D9XP97_9ORYZ